MKRHEEYYRYWKCAEGNEGWIPHTDDGAWIQKSQLKAESKRVNGRSWPEYCPEKLERGSLLFEVK